MAWFNSGRAHHDVSIWRSALSAKRRVRGSIPRHVSISLCTSRWLGGPPSKRTREGSNPSWCTTPRSTSGEVIGLSSRSGGRDTHTRCPVSAGGSGGLATNEAGGGSTPPGDSTCSRQRIWRRRSERRATQFDSAREHQRAWSNGGSLLSYGRNRPFRVRRSPPFPTTSSDGRALIRRSARARLPPSGLRGASQLVLGLLLQGIAARFDSEAPYNVYR
jgi:hypothetical protein